MPDAPDLRTALVETLLQLSQFAYRDTSPPQTVDEARHRAEAREAEAYSAAMFILASLPTLAHIDTLTAAVENLDPADQPPRRS
jgi:hypothetical protein